MKKLVLFSMLLAVTLSLVAAPRQYVLFELITGTW